VIRLWQTPPMGGKQVVKAVFDALAWGFQAAWWGALPVLGGWLGVYILILGTPGQFWFGYLRVMVVIVAAAVVIGLIAELSGANKTNRAARAAAALQEAEAERVRLNEMAVEKARAERVSAEAVEAFGSLPGWLAQARQGGVDAQQHYRNGAYSPFWASIEGAYAALGEYNRTLSRLGVLSGDYVHAIGRYRSFGGTEALAPFPVEIDTSEAARAATSQIRRLAPVVYDAQCHPVFAQIWEQRRTTAAVIEGFANLEQAVSRMGGAISASVGALASSLKQAERGITAAVAGVDASTRAVNASVVASSEQDKRLQRELRLKIGDIERQLAAY